MKDNKEKLPECCKPIKGVKSGVIAGILSHSGCIAIILFAVLGVAFGSSIFRSFISNRYYLYIVVIFSLTIATFSAFLYIRRFEDRRMKKHWRYLSILYTSVIVINILMIYFVFPMTANLISGQAIISEDKDRLLINMNSLPCSGHAPLVISELGEVNGISSVKYVSGNIFEVYYNSSMIDKEEILNQNICKEFGGIEEI